MGKLIHKKSTKNWQAVINEKEILFCLYSIICYISTWMEFSHHCNAEWNKLSTESQWSTILNLATNCEPSIMSSIQLQSFLWTQHHKTILCCFHRSHTIHTFHQPEMCTVLTIQWWFIYMKHSSEQLIISLALKIFSNKAYFPNSV